MCRAVFLGATSPREDPLAYVDAVAAVLAHAATHLRPRGVPIVVNTPGWVKGACGARADCVYASQHAH
jgi:polynucleotide 5'-kinase involved in rRNA processing